MAEQIVREIWLFQKRRVPPIDIVAGSQIPIALEMKDYTIPAGAVVKVYARPWGRETTYVQDAAADGNTVVFTPKDGFFREGWNSVQLEINGSKIPLALDVSGGVRLSDGGSGATPEAVRPLVERAEAAAAKAAEDAANAVNPLVTEASAAAESAAGQAAAAKSSADAAEKSAQGIRDNAEKIDRNAEDVNQLKDDIVKIGTKIVSENLLDYSKVESGYYDLSGVFHESDTYAHAKVYVDDLVGKPIYFSKDIVSDIISIDASFITEYDSNGSVMRITNAKNVNNYTIPDGVAYVIISATTTNLGSTVMITLDSIPEKFVPYFEPYFKATDRFALELKSQINTFTVVECWGDSLTKGVGASENNYENAYPNQLQKMLGDAYTVNNLGIGGEGVKQISARQGGKLSFAQPFTIPKNTIATNVSFLNDDGEIIKHQNQKGNGVNPCYIDGVKGTVAWDKSNLTNTFVREERGKEVKITKEMPLVTDGMINHRGNIMVIWAGTNDKPKTKEKAQYVIDSIRDMIAYAETDKYIVVGLTSKDYMGDFIDNNTKIWSQNFGTKFVNVRKYLMNYALEDESITPTEQDNLDIENGEIPSSLRSDSVHLNAKGYHCIAKLVYERGKLLGYW